MESECKSALSISFDATPLVSYAMAHNDVSVISRLVIDEVAEDAQGATLLLDVADATGPLSVPHRVTVDLAVGAPTVVTDLRLLLDPAAMLQVEEQRPGVVRARVEINGEIRAEHSIRVRVLAAQQWLADPLALGLEMLATYVMPNHPAVTALMSDVADRLLAATGSPSVQGYQAGPERVDEIVQAVVEAMRARGIRYSEPPASWADIGQKIRTPGDVLDRRVGTCLDTVVVMAAALEQAGIRPLIWLVEGHAFLGYWREESSLGVTAQTDAAEVVNRVDLDQIRLVETTMVTDRAKAANVAEAQQQLYRGYLGGGLDRVLGVTDVRQARRDRIVPLPARTRESDGQVRVSVYTPPAVAEQTVARPAPVSPLSSRPGVVQPVRVTQWKNALLDLSLRNRLLNYTTRSGLALSVPSECLGQLEDLLHQGVGIALRASDDVAAIDRERGIHAGRELPVEHLLDLLAARRTVYIDVTEGAYTTRLRGLAHKARTIVEETGANNLYLALGSLVWDLDGRALRSPLILVPVTVKATNHSRYRVFLDDAGSSTPNYCLVEKLRQAYGLEIPGLATPVLDSAGIDLDATLQATRMSIAQRGLPFRVESTADLTVLQFAKFRLWKDLDESWPAFANNPLVRHLIYTPTESFVDPVEGELIPDLEGLAESCPVPADSSQLRAVVDAAAGRTFVLEGPPGTGKSQTITNLLAHAVANGKRVLFVAEKRAALDVVQKRLDAVGMGPLSLDLHDKASSPVAVREQIKRALEHTVAADQPGIAATLDELRSARRGLVRYAYKLHDRNPAGLSLYSAREAVLAIGDGVEAMPFSPEALGSLGSEALDRLRVLFDEIAEVAYPARPRPGHPWAFITDGSPAAPELAEVLPAARRFDDALRSLSGHPTLTEVLGSVQVPDDLRVLAVLLGDRKPLAVLDEIRTSRWNAAIGAVLREVAEFTAVSHPGLDMVEPAFLDLPLAQIHAAAREASASGFFGRKKRLRSVCDQLTPVLRVGVSIPPKKALELSAALVAVEAGVERLAAKIGSIPGLAVPVGWNPFLQAGQDVLADRIQSLRWAASVVDPATTDPSRARFVQPLRRFMSRGVPGDPAPVAAAAAAATELFRACRVEPDAVVDWAGERGLIAQWESGRVERGLGDAQLGSLRRWLALLTHVEPLRSEHLDGARLMLLRGELAADDARRSFELGLALASIEERRSSGGLADFDAAAHERTIARYVAASDRLRDHLTRALPQQILRSRSFDPMTTGGRIGLLHRQITRQRGGMRVRELMAQFGDLITAAMPCTLVSPDSIARFFPAEKTLFDIVVFDEASQVRVADAIGAMGRASSVVVVGDSKQMPPTSFAETSTTSTDPDADGTGDSVEDEESILTECVQARVARHRLTWHYRSQDESLIAFSNRHYYDGSLMSFPAPVSGGPGTRTGVSLVRVDGHFHRSGQGELLRTNPVEAEAVVIEIRNRFAASPETLPSLGVVTFNQQQRAYIEGLLRDTDDPRIIEALDDADEGLFVKNLENVQGDERDVIFFSTAFSANERGVLPLNFGPLNRSGGERRLNVAVTRARRQIVVFSSFDPAALRAENTTSVGVKHLRTYLDMAATGPSVLPNDLRRRAPVDRHCEDIAEALRDQGLSARTRVGLSDFKIDIIVARLDAPDRPAVAVLLDGPDWANRLTVRDRDGLPEEVLSNLLKWPSVERVWLPDWLAHPDAVLARLRHAVESTAHVPTVVPGASDAPVVKVRAVEKPDESAFLVRDFRAAFGEAASGVGRQSPPAFEPWRTARRGTVEVLDALPGAVAAAEVASVLTDVVATEGPIHADRLAKLVAGAFGLNRVTEARRTAILRHLPSDLSRDDNEPVVWPPHLTPTGWTGFRTTPQGVDRPFEHVPLREIANAMVAAVQAAAGMQPSELRREVVGVFGGRRLTAGIIERLDAAMELGVTRNMLAIDAAGTVTTGLAS